MNKVQFNKLSVMEQLQYVNGELEKGESLRGISAKLGLSKTTIRDRLEKIGYKFDQEKRKYINFEEELQKQYKSNNVAKVFEEEPKGQVITKMYNNNNEIEDVFNYVAVTKETEGITKVHKSNNDIKEEKQKITKVHKDNNYNHDTKVIIEMQSKLDELYEWYLKEKNIIEPVELKLNTFEGDAINRTFKIYKKELEDFKKFCDENKQYKVQDIISQAIREFLNKYI